MQVDQLIALVHMKRGHILWLYHKGLLLHPRLCGQGAGFLAQIPDFIPLVLGECHSR